MSRAIAQKGANTTAAIAAIILFGILVFGSVQLKINGLVGDGALVSLLTMSGVFGLSIYFRGRLKKLGPSGLDLHEAVRDLSVRQKYPQSIASAFPVSGLVVFIERAAAFLLCFVIGIHGSIVFHFRPVKLLHHS
jgi:hypothetical protein